MCKCMGISVGFVVAVVLSVFSLQVLQAGEPSKVTVLATGSGKTRDGALVDACRLAVAQVHGSRVVGGVMKTNETNKHSINFGPTFEETRDATVLTFQGLLLKYKVTKEIPAKGVKPWAVSINADVLTAVPDRFSGKIAVVTPSPHMIQKTMGGSANIADFSESVARSIDGWFANNSHFVILEREDESALNDELARATSEISAVSEKSKLKAQKVADIVIVFQGSEVKFIETVTKFKMAGNVYRCEASATMTVKAIDVATKGEIGRVTLSIKGDRKASRSNDQSRLLALQNLAEKVNEELPLSGLQILSALDVTRVQISENGTVTILSPRQAKGLSQINEMEIWTTSEGETSSKFKLGTFKFDATLMRLEIQGLAKKIEPNQVFSFKPVIRSN